MKQALFAILLFSSCTPTYLISKEEFKKIPYGSTKVVVTSEISSDSLMNTFTRLLAADGFPVNTNKIAMQVTTEGKSIGGGTLMKTYIYVEQLKDSSRATMTGAYGLDAQGNIAFSVFAGNNSSGTDIAKFTNSATSRPDLVYQKMVAFAQMIPNSTIRHAK